MTKIRGKEIKLKSPKNYTINLGTVNNKDPKCLYFEIKGWVTPVNQDELDYRKIVKQLKKRFNDKLYTKINNTPFNKNVFIVDLDLRDSGIEFNKMSYYNCEVTLYQKGDTIQLTKLKNEISKISNELVHEILEPFEHFKFHKKKI